MKKKKHRKSTSGKKMTQEFICKEIGNACDAFLKKRGIKVGRCHFISNHTTT